MGIRKYSIDIIDISLTDFLAYSDRKTIHFHYFMISCIFNSTLIILDFIVDVNLNVIKE